MVELIWVTKSSFLVGSSWVESLELRVRSGRVKKYGPILIDR